MGQPDSEPAQAVRAEPRWPVMLTSIAVFTLVVLLPPRIRAFPGWVPYLVVITLNVPMMALTLAVDKRDGWASSVDFEYFRG